MNVDYVKKMIVKQSCMYGKYGDKNKNILVTLCSEWFHCCLRIMLKIMFQEFKAVNNMHGCNSQGKASGFSNVQNCCIYLPPKECSLLLLFKKKKRLSGDSSSVSIQLVFICLLVCCLFGLVCFALMMCFRVGLWWVTETIMTTQMATITSSGHMPMEGEWCCLRTGKDSDIISHFNVLDVDVPYCFRHIVS